MFSKGAKRKLDEDEEGLEGKTLAAAPPSWGPEGLSRVSYTLQRQTIFNISLMKLYSGRPLGEPRLERRVLINNMLRRIQDELKQEGSPRPLLLPPSPPPDDPMDEGFLSVTAQVAPPSALLMPMIAPPPSPHPMSPPPSPAPQAFAQRGEGGPAPLEACLTPASLLEDDGVDSAFCVPSPPTPPLSPPPTQPPPPAPVSGGAPPAGAVPCSLSDMEVGPSPAITRTAAANTTTMTTSPSPPPHTPFLTPLSPPHTPPPRDYRAKAEPAAGVFLLEHSCPEAPPTPPPPGPVETSSPAPCPPPPSPSGFLSDLALDDVLFADIDTSMYDFDPCTTAGAVGVGGGGGLTKLSPGVTPDELLKSLAAPYSGPVPQVSTNQPFKIDLTELDHIMEVLVGS